MKNYIRKLLKEENLENPPKPEVGDILYCHTTLEMEDDGSEEAIEGKEYEVKGYNNYDDFWITNESGHKHNFGTKRDESSLYTKWFTLIPPDIRDIDFFGQLYEQEEDEFEWARNAINLRRAIITNKGDLYSTYLHAMAKTAVPGAMECVKKIQQKFNLDDSADISGNVIFGDVERRMLHGACIDHLKNIGSITPQINNGDLCYVWPTPFHPSNSNDVIYHLERISDGKHFVISKNGFRFLNETENLTEQKEDDFEWAKYEFNSLPEKGDIFRVNVSLLVKIEGIMPHNRQLRKRTLVAGNWGEVEYFDNEYDVVYRDSFDNGETWQSPQKTPLGWAMILIDRGYWTKINE